VSWSKWGGIEPIDADTYLNRVEQEEAHEVIRAAERTTKTAAEGTDEQHPDSRDEWRL
jgi:proline racemase